MGFGATIETPVHRRPVVCVAILALALRRIDELDN